MSLMCSAHTKGLIFCRLHGIPLSALPDYLYEAQKTPISKRKLAPILCSKPSRDITLDVGDLFDVYI